MNQLLATPPNKAKSCCTSSTANAPSTCFHCGGRVSDFSDISLEVEGSKHIICSQQCKSAAQFVYRNKLDQFYRHRQTVGGRATTTATFSQPGMAGKLDWQFMNSDEAAQDYLVTASTGIREVAISVKGLYCTSCSWLIVSSLQTLSPDIKARVDVSANIVYVQLIDPAIEVSEVFSIISELGYSPNPISAKDLEDLQQSAIDHERKLYLKRIAVAGLGMMQVMTYAVATYLGEYQGIDAGMQRFFALTSMLVATLVVFYSGSLFFANAWNDLKNRHLGMDVPIALAIAAAYLPSVYLTLSNTPGHIYFDSAVMFVFFLLLGRYLEMRARYRLSETPEAVMQLLPTFVEVDRAEQGMSGRLLIRPSEVKRGDCLSLSAEEIVPFDALLLSGEVYVDESMLTGEAQAQVKSVGDQVLAGSLVHSGQATVKAVNDWSESSIAMLEKLLREGQQVRSSQQDVLTAVGRVFIAGVLLLTAIVAAFWSAYAPDRVFHVMLAMLIAACPCAFSLAIPVGVTAASTALRKVGVLLTNSSALRNISAADIWCFDKTGTLTEGRCEIAELIPVGTMSVARCLSLAAALEKHSQHALAYAFRGIESDLQVTDFEELPGSGIRGKIDGHNYWIGRREWVAPCCDKAGINQVESSQGADVPVLPQAPPCSEYPQLTELVFADERRELVTILIADKVRSSARLFISDLQVQKKQTVILSGDAQQAVKSVADHLRVNQAYGRLLPADKVAIVKRFQASSARVVMLGDGVNDAQVLQQADVAIVMASGSELSRSQADVVLLHGRFEQLSSLQSVARKTQLITRQNLFWALGYNLLALPLAASGFLTPWVAALGMSSSSLIVVLNALRISNTVES